MVSHRLFGERRRETGAQLPRINARDHREQSRFVGCGPRKTTTLWKTLRLPECTARVLVWISGRSDEELECDGGKRIDIVGTRRRRSREPLRGAAGDPASAGIPALINACAQTP
jgi:hypothetical protein